MRGLFASWKKSKTQWKPNAAQFFLACLLVLLPGCLPRFYFGAVGLAVDLIVGLAISRAVSMAL